MARRFSTTAGSPGVRWTEGALSVTGVQAGIVHLIIDAGSDPITRIVAGPWGTGSLEGVQVTLNGDATVDGEPVTFSGVMSSCGPGGGGAEVNLSKTASVALAAHGGTVILIDVYR